MTNKSSKKKVVILAVGGTGGHVFPGLAVAKKLSESNFEVIWLGKKDGLESKIAEENNFKIFYINIIGVRGKNILNWIKAPILLITSVIKSIILIYKLKPCCILGMGGFVSAAGGIAAILTRTSLIIQEQNAVEGTTNKFLSLFSKKIFTGFPAAFKSNKNTIYTGNPLRESFYNFTTPRERFVPEKIKNILVLGGSLGAHQVNKIVTEAVKKIKLETDINFYINHQTGLKDKNWVEDFYSSLGVNSFVQDFIEDINQFYQNADLVISRAGALTISEITATGVASILIPYPHAINNHQEENANWLVNSNAAYKFTQSELTSKKLYSVIKVLLKDDDLRIKMAEKSQSLLMNNAVEKIVETCKDFSYAN